MKKRLTGFIHGLRHGNRMSQLINLRRNSSTLPLRRSLILLSALIMSVGQVWGAYYYRGNQNGWSATQMTASADGFYEYFAAKGYTNNGNKNNIFKVSTTTDSWDYNKAYDTPGFNKTDITNAGDWDSDNMCVYNDVDFYILVYKPSTTVNATAKPIVCYASYLPDNRSCAIYFVNSSDWTGTLKAYGWFYDGTNGRNATWPGATMTNTTKTNNGHAIWSYTFTNSYPIVIFNNGSSQTSDITMGYSANGKMYNNGSWVALAYDVELNQQSGSGGSTSIIATCGSAMPGSKTAPTREGYTFGGYYTSTGGSGTKYYNANMTSAATWPADGSGPTTLYAKWTKTTYSVTINNDGHGSTTPSGAQGSVAQIDGIAISASADDDYEFFNWTIESGTGSFYDATSESTTFYPTSEATIQANFRSTITNSLMVTAGAHVGTVTGSTDPVTLGSKYDISATPETGYAFSSWTASPAANATFDNATSASTKVQVNNGSVTVTANAEEIMRTITIDGGTVYGGVATSTTAGIDTKGKVTANAPAAGKKFTGWSLGDGVSLAGGYSLTDQTIEINATANATVTATYADRGSVKMYFAKPIGWSKVYAYAWKGSDDAVKNAVWPGIELETTETIDCVDYYIYQYYTEADGIGGAADGNSEWTKVVFNDNNDARKTGNLNIADGHYYYKSSATNTSGSTTTIEHIWYLKGTMNSPSTWSDTDPLTHSCASHSGEITVVLTEGTSYQFKIYDAVSDSWWSNSAALGESKPITGTMASAQTLYSNDSYDMYITASKTAEYRFVVTNTNTTTPKIQVFFPDTYLAGDFNSWSTSANPFENGVVSVHLTEGDHLFKVVSSGTWYGNGGTIEESVGSWEFTTNGGNCKLTVATEGDYLFGWNGISHHVTIIFPEEQAKMKFNSEQYIYFDTRRLGNTGYGWNAAEFIARFWVKNYATGEDVANSIQTKAQTLEEGVYYTQLPENENIGQIQINRLDPDNTSEIWCTANKVFAFKRANANQNCLQEETGRESWCNAWTPQWTTYCPPVSSVSLTDNGTIEHTLYGGNGTEGSPFLIKTGEDIKVMGSAVSAVSDANMTAYYQFKKDDENVGEASSTNTASITASSVSGTKEKITVEAYNVFNSTSGTSATSSDIYYEVRTPYTISYNKGSGVGISGSHVNMRKLKGVDHHLPFEVFTRTGYRQTGWTTSDGGAQTHELGGYYTGDADQTFYPVWTAIPYTITLDNYGGEGGTNSVVATYGQSTRFSILNPTREGYTFCGWYSGQSTVVIDTEGNLIRGVSGFTNAEGQWTCTSDCTLKAIWKHNSSLGMYNFRYGWQNYYYANEWNDVNFGEATDDHMRTVDFTIPTVTGNYYVGYDGEYCSKGINGASGSSNQSGLNGLGLYPGIYGSIIPSSTGAVGRLIIWDNSSSYNLGVRFQPSGYGLTYASGTQAFSKADDHLWQTATITLNSDDVEGTFKVGLATATEGTYVDCNLSKSDNASALNERKDKLVSEQSYPAIPNMADGQRGRFVIWDDSGDQWYLSFLPVYSVTYDANGGTGEAPAAATEYRTNETPEVLGNTFTHEGYSFLGWNTEADGTGAGYSAGDSLAKIGADVTLYAQWNINSHAITYTAPSNGSYTIQVADGEAVSTSTEADYGQTVTLSATSAPCYVFNGWVVTGATVADASALTTTFTMPNTDVTIEALFVRENIAIGKTAKAGWSRRGDCPNKNAGEVPDKAVDGNTGSHFISYANTNNALAWWAVDLGASYRLNSFDAVWNNGRTPSHYLIQVTTSTPSDFADDVAMSDANWITAVEVNEPQTEGTGGNQYVFGAISARYVRLVSVERPEFGLSEFRVYADASSSDPVVTPTLVSAAVYSDLSAGSATLTLTATDHNGAALHTFLLQDQTGKHYRVTTDGSDHATLSGLNDQRYVFTVWAIEEGNTSSSSMVIVGESSFSNLTNLALNKPAHAVRYRENNSNYAPGKANDGNLGSHWNAGSDSGEAIDEEEMDNIWWYVDLQDQYSIKYISMFWSLASANSFIMQVRKDAPSVAEANDDSAWETFLDYSGTQSTGEGEGDANLYGDVSGNKAAFLFTPKGRYLRFRAKDADHWEWGVQLRELRVFGNGYLPIDDVAPVLSAASYNGVTGDNSGVKFNVTATDNLTDPVVDYRVIDGQGRIHNVTADEGVITITGLTSGRNQLVTIYALDEAGNKSAGREVEFDYLNPNENLALNKTCWASGTADRADELKENANNGSIDDGKAKYFWGAGTNAWWIVDLGDTYQLKNIECFFTTDKMPSAYKLYGRQNDPGDALRSTNDGWAELADKTSDINAGTTESDKNEHDISYPYAVRYVKFYATSSEIKLIELRVFGKAFATPDETAPAWTDAACDVTSAVNHTITMTLEATDANPENIYDFVINVDNGTSNKDYARSTTALSNVITIDDATFIEPCETYTITAKCYDHVGNENTKVFANVNTTVSGNIALGKTTAAGTTEGGGDGSSRAVDGNTGTEWSGNSNEKVGGVNQWLKVDLGKNYSINEIRISWGANSGTWPRDYELQSSYDGVNYRTFIHRTSKDAERDNTFNELSVHGRYIRVWANEYGDSYGMCITEIEVYGECYDGEADDEPNDFTGGGATNAWTDLSNWPKGVLPGETDEVHLLAPMVIPDGTTVKIAKLVIATGGKQAGGMAEATGHLTIAPTAALIVSGEIKRCSDASAPATQSATTAADITIQSSAAGNGALVFTNGTGAEANAATVEMFSKATTEGTDWTWQYIAAPAAVSALSNYYGGYLYKWNSGWEAVGNSDNMELFAGYCVSYPSAGHTFAIEGALAPTTEQSITVPAGKSMVVGNSWTAPIQISQMTAGDFTNVDQTVYLYNTGNDENGTAGTYKEDRYAAGTYVPVPIAETATVGVTKVSSLQGFFVKNNSGSAGTLSLSYSKHVVPTGENSAINGPMHAPKRVSDETERAAVLRMKVSGSRYDDRLILLEREDFTTGYDAGHDGEKIGESYVAPWLYTSREDGTADAVAALPDLEGTLINFRAGEDEIYTFGFEYEAEDAEPLYLLDLTNNAYTRVETGGSYTFVTTDKADHKRFALTRYRAPQIVTGVEDAQEDNVRSTKAVKFIENDKLYILLNGVLYDGTGKRAK